MNRVVTRKNGIEVRLPGKDPHTFTTTEQIEALCDNFQTMTLDQQTEFWDTVAELVDDHMGGDPDSEIDFENKKTMDMWCEHQMDELEGDPQAIGEYLGYAWGILKAYEAKLKEYTEEEYLALDEPTQNDYYWYLPMEKHRQLADWKIGRIEQQNFKKDAEWIMHRCEDIKEAYGADSRCAIEIVKATLLKQVNDNLEGIHTNPTAPTELLEAMAIMASLPEDIAKALDENLDRPPRFGAHAVPMEYITDLKRIMRHQQEGRDEE